MKDNMKKNEIMESDLYEPVKILFEKMGYDVQGEVKGCDATAKKGNELIIIELKKSFTLKLVYQVMERKALTDKVYAAIPRPENFKAKNVKNMERLLRELKIGLIIVTVDSDFKRAEIKFEPGEKTRAVNAEKRKKINDEINERHTNVNTGGVSKKKIFTAYREKSVRLACIMERVDKIRSSVIKQIYEIEKASYILNANYYGWFDKIEKGVYALSEKGREYLKENENEEVIKYYRKEAEKYDV